MIIKPESLPKPATLPIELHQQVMTIGAFGMAQ
jgi:hypothetical protein